MTKQFDKDGDGELNEEERNAMRAAMRERFGTGQGGGERRGVVVGRLDDRDAVERSLGQALALGRRQRGRGGRCRQHLVGVGTRNRGTLFNAFHRRHGPLLSGIRCLRREVFEAVPESHLKGFAIETGLNWACRQLGLPIETTLLYGIKHLVKEKKRGLVRGSLARARMLVAVYRAYTSLRFRQPGAQASSLRSSLLAGVEYTIF